MYDHIRRMQEQNDDKFTGSASLWIGAKVPPDADYEFEYDNKVDVPFGINIDYRSWGIDGINVHLSDKIKINARKVFYDDKGNEAREEQIEVEVDLAQLKIDWIEGQVVAPGELSLNLTPEGAVDYTKSTIEFYYIKPDYEA